MIDKLRTWNTKDDVKEYGRQDTRLHIRKGVGGIKK